MRRLDELSQQAVKACIIRASMLTAYVLVAWRVGLFPGADFCNYLSTAFNLAALVGVMTASLRREKAGQGSLNSWDEALTFNGVALFTHLLHRLQA